MAQPKTQKYLIYTAIFLMLFSIFMTGFTFWYLASNQEQINAKLQVSLKEELAKYKFPTQEPLDIGDAKIAIAVGQYCESHDECRGRDGQSIQGPSGPMGMQGIMGLLGNPGPQGIKGDTGAQGDVGPQGEPGIAGQDGAPGRTLEQRCAVIDPDTRRIEQKYTDDESWAPLYYLSKGQSCPEEIT